MPTFRQLEYLVMVGELGSFTRAAEELHVSQPALSSQIAVLEREIGARLFDRLSRTVHLTPAGRAMFPYAKASLAEAQRGVSATRQTAGLEIGELQVATVHSTTLGLLPAPLRLWRQARPGIQLRLHEYRHGDELKAAMSRGEADVAIGPTPSNWYGPLTNLGSEELVLVVSSDDPLAELRGPLELNRLTDRSWVHFAPGHGLAEVLDKACSNAGFSPKVALRVEQTASAPLLAAAGLGPTLVPASIVPENFEGRIFATSPATLRTLAVYSRPNGDKLTSAFHDFIAAKIELMPDHVDSRLRSRK
ncbi:MAG: LysR family transcriptional regulator [Acidimicrobiales bacterium]|jgi:DNA-binding transcriptional LysR family regulator